MTFGLVRDAQKKEAVIGHFLQFKKKGDKPEWNDISAQAEFKSYWAQWESLVIVKEGLLFRELVGPGKSQTMQVLLPMSLVDVASGMLHDSVTTEHMGVRRMLACVQIRF